MKKVVLIGGALVIIVVAAGVWYLFSSLDLIVKNAIESHGSELTGTPVRVESVELSLSEGKGTVRNLTVANPAGYSERPIFAFQEVTLDIDLSTGTEPITLLLARIAAPTVFFELDDQGRSNLEVLQEQIGRRPTEPGTGGDRGPSPRIRIQRFELTDGSIEADLQTLGAGQATMALPPVLLTDVGGADGASPADVGAAIVRALGGEVGKVVARQGINRAIDELLGGETGEKVKELLDSILNKQ